MRKNAPWFAPRRARAFTLIELLVSMTVLSIIVLLISQLFSSATSVATSNRKRLDADAQARLVFDRLALDFGKMIKRNDVDYLFAKIEGKDDTHSENDKMFFYSEAPAFYSTTASSGSSSTPDPRSSVALVGYRINAAYQLERLGKQLSWDGTPAPSSTGTTTPGGMIFLSPGASAANPDPATTLAVNWQGTIGASTDNPPYTPQTYDQDYQVLAEQVCRLEFCFQLKDGSFSPIPVCPVINQTTPIKNRLDATTPPTTSDSSGAGFAVGSRWYNNTDGRGYFCVNSATGAAVWNILGMQDVRAVVVGLAILDGTSAGALPTGAEVTINGRKFRPPKLSALSTALADVHPKDATSPGTTSTDATVPSLPTPAPTGTPVPVRLMAEAWGNRTKQPDFTQVSGLSGPVAAQVRIYQRSFVLNSQ